MKLVKGILLAALLAACWGIAWRYDVDLRVLYRTAGMIPENLTRVYDPTIRPPFYYGPITLVLLPGMKWISYPALRVLWIVLQTIAFLLCWRFLRRLFPELDGKSFWPWLVVWLFAINPVHNNFQSGNIQLWLAAILFGAEILYQRGSRESRFLSGLLVVLAAAVKVFPLFLVALYWVRPSRAGKLGILAGGITALVLPVVFFGVEGGWLLHREFLQGLGSYSVENPFNTDEILCLPSLIHRLGFSLGWTPVVSTWLTRGVTALVTGLFFISADRTRRSESLQVWSLALALMTALNPSTRPHYFIFLLPVLAGAVIRVIQTRRTFEVGLLAISTGLIAFTTEGILGKALNNRIEQWNVPTVGMLLLCALGFLSALDTGAGEITSS